jgi:hypothetical protein
MAQTRSLTPRLSPDMIRVRGDVGSGAWEEAADPGEAPAAAWKEDLRLFGFTWLAGFVFFFAYLS